MWSKSSVATFLERSDYFLDVDESDRHATCWESFAAYSSALLDVLKMPASCKVEESKLASLILLNSAFMKSLTFGGEWLVVRGGGLTF